MNNKNPWRFAIELEQFHGSPIGLHIIRTRYKEKWEEINDEDRVIEVQEKYKVQNKKQSAQKTKRNVLNLFPTRWETETEIKGGTLCSNLFFIVNVERHCFGWLIFL